MDVAQARHPVTKHPNVAYARLRGRCSADECRAGRSVSAEPDFVTVVEPEANVTRSQLLSSDRMPRGVDQSVAVLAVNRPHDWKGQWLPLNWLAELPAGFIDQAP